MKFKDLSKEEQEHFKKVVEYCQENGLQEQLEEATHIDRRMISSSLTKFAGVVEHYYSNSMKKWLCTRSNEVYKKPEDYKDLLEDSKKPKTMYKLKIIYKNNSEPMTLNFTEELKDSALELFNLIKNDMVALGKGDIGYSVLSSDLSFAIDVSEIASVFLNEVEDGC